MTARRSAAPFLALAGLPALVGCDPPPPVGKEQGNTCPQITGPDVDGNALRLTDLRGKVVMVSFWGSWCPPCRANLPHERTMIERDYKGRPFTILGVATDPPDRLREFLKANPAPWPNIVDDRGALCEEWGIHSFPSVVLVDHRGVIRGVWKGGLNPAELQTEIARLVDRAERD